MIKGVSIPRCYREIIYRWMVLELHRLFSVGINEMALKSWTATAGSPNAVGEAEAEAIADYAAVMKQCLQLGLDLMPVINCNLIVFALMKDDHMLAALKIERDEAGEGTFIQDLIAMVSEA